MDFSSLRFEEHLLRDPYSVKAWLHYLLFHERSPHAQRNLIYERALAKLPSSYKLWMLYLKERMAFCASFSITSPQYEAVNVCFERCLIHLHTMPRIWHLYCTFLSQQRVFTRTRHAFDRALQSLPITQHLKWVWPHYLTHVLSTGVPATIARVYRRYLQVQPSEKENVIDWMRSAQQWDDAALLLVDCINDESFTSIHGKSKHELWTELLTLLIRHAASIVSLDTERIIRSGIVRFTNDSGRLYCALASWHIRCGRFSRARDVYEEGITTVGTVRDFTQIFDAYSKYEEAMLTTLMRQAADQSTLPADDEAFALETDLDLSILRIESLLARRPLLLSSVLLRQNPHNTDEWLKRITLFTSPTQIIQQFTDAVTTINPSLATGSLSAVWSAFAHFYIDHDDMDNARTVYAKAVNVPYKRIDELVELYVEWVELELKLYEYQRARTILSSVCQQSAKRRGNEGDSETVQHKIHRSIRLWSLYADLEENLGTLTTTRAVYDAMLSLRIITPQLLLNYAALLVEHGYHEESYRVYERGVEVFHYPHVLVIWLAYLKGFIERNKGSKRERVRDLFEQCLSGVPAEHARKIYLLYAKYEEDYGLSRRAMDVYQRACSAVPVKDRYALYVIYIARVTQRFGLSKAREVYEESMQKLSTQHVIPICLAYAKLEVRLGEVDRARALYQYVSQWADAREVRGQKVWKEWEGFEVEHGNEETYREMLRVKRSVAAAFASVGRTSIAGTEEDGQAEVQRLMTGGLIEPSKTKRKRKHDDDQHKDEAAEDEDEEEEDEEEEAAAAESANEEDASKRLRTNPEEIDLGDLDEDEDEEEKPDPELEQAMSSIDAAHPAADDEEVSGADIVEQPVPASLFGLQD